MPETISTMRPKVSNAARPLSCQAVPGWKSRGSAPRRGMKAVGAFAAYLLSAMVLQVQTHQGFSIVRLIFLALLLANVRGIWMAASWQPSEEDPAPMKLNANWRDKLADQWPAAIWPWGRFVFYVLAAVEIGLLLLSWISLAILAARG